MRREALAMSGILRADAVAEQLDAAAGAGALDLRGLELAGRAELLGHRGRERIDRRRTDDGDGIARRLGVRGDAQAQTMPAASEEIRMFASHVYCLRL